jgi:hypothetical protein
MDNYEVGYKKPPKAYRWKPGESGNPAGRPRGARKKRDPIAEELRQASIDIKKDLFRALGLPFRDH